MTSGDRMRAYLKSRGLKHDPICKKIGLSTGYFSDVNNIGADKLDLITNYFPRLSLIWLVKGIGKEELPPQYPGLDQFTADDLSEQFVDYSGVQTQEERQRLLSEGYIRIPGMPPCDSAISIRSENMAPRLNRGDIVIYKKQQPDAIFWGEMYVVLISHGDQLQLSVFYVLEGEQEGMVRLRSHNPDYPSNEYPLSSLLWIGLVKATVYINCSV